MVTRETARLFEYHAWTFVIPNTAFGIFGALAGPVLTTNKPTSFSVILVRIPCVLAWNWLNLIVFDLANQRSPNSVTEDTLNKPWRPIPAGHVTPAQMRRLLLAALPVVQAINFFLGGWQETSLLFGLTWMYNDLRGGDDSFLLRNMIISLAYGLYSGGSLRVACSAGHTLHETGFRWVFIITAIIFSTMHIQDLKDVAGDQARSRQSAPLVLGDSVARWTIAVPILAWSVFCPLYLREILRSAARTAPQSSVGSIRRGTRYKIDFYPRDRHRYLLLSGRPAKSIRIGGSGRGHQ